MNCMNILSPDKTYKTKNNLIYSCQYHVIFCTKYRRKVLTEKISSKLKTLIIEKQKEYDYKIIELEVMPDHVHLLIDVNPKIGIYSVISKIKGYTSSQLRKTFPELKSRLPCLWSGSKFISTCGTVSLETVKRYIEEQKGK